MRNQQIRPEDGRRHFLRSVTSLGAAAFMGSAARAAAEPPPEITRVRFDHAPVLCMAPQYLAEDLLRMEGFTDIEFLDIGTQLGPDALAEGKIDFSLWDGSSSVWAMDREKGFVVLAGIHAGCWELVGNDRVRAIRDMRGKKIATRMLGDIDHAWISSVLAYVGINPQTSVEWVISSSYANSMKMFVEGKVDATLVTPPRAQELRAKKIGHVLVDSSQDRPWSQYFCCLITSSREFAVRYPVATKRVMRALLKASDICAKEPERAARFMVDKGHTPRYDFALEVIKGLPFQRWRDAHPEDTLRFYALRLHEAGMIKTHPNKLIAQSTDWRFMNELRKELKG
jgi:NitT/TauT family transport system substrate-binding protein